MAGSADRVGRMLGDSMLTTTVLLGVVILVGLVGIVVPILPGLILIWGAVLVWALAVQDPVGWGVLAVSTALALLGWFCQYAIPGRGLRSVGIPNRTLLVGLVLGIVGFFVIPVVGLILGFVGGVYVAEAVRLGAGRAWPSTVHAVKAATVSWGIEIATGLLIAAAFLIGAWRVLG